MRRADWAYSGFSFVYRADDIDTGDKFALKHILCTERAMLHEARTEIEVRTPCPAAVAS